MPSTPWKPVSWSPNEVITSDRLNAMTSNDNWLNETKLSGRYAAHGSGAKYDGLRILGGAVRFSPGKSANRSASVSFGDFFSPACKPIVTTGINSIAQRRITLVHNGPGKQFYPTRAGMELHLYVFSAAKKGKNKLTASVFVNYIALGY